MNKRFNSNIRKGEAVNKHEKHKKEINSLKDE